VSEVGADGLDLGGQDDLMLIGDGLGVVALQKAAQALDHARVRVAEVDPSFGCGQRLVGVRCAAEAPTPTLIAGTGSRASRCRCGSGVLLAEGPGRKVSAPTDPYDWVESWAWEILKRSGPLPGAADLVLLRLAAQGNRDGMARPSTRTLGDMVGRSDRVVRDART
jgi:hypothetical protein